MKKPPTIDALSFDYSPKIEACYHGALIPPTKRSLGIAVRPNPKGDRPVIKCYFQPDLMKATGFRIGNHVLLSFTDTATHIKIEKVNCYAEGAVALRPAANNYHCIDYFKKQEGTQLRARIAKTMTEEFIQAFSFDDKCNLFTEPSYIRKGQYIIAPLDDMPIFAKKLRK